MNCPFCERRRCNGDCAEAVAHRAGMLEHDPFGDDTFVPLETQLRPPPPPRDDRGHTVIDEANELCARVRRASEQDMVAVRARPTVPAPRRVDGKAGAA